MCLDGCDEHFVVLNVAAFEVVNIRVTKGRVATEEEYVTHTLQILLILRNLIGFQLFKFMLVKEDNLLWCSLQFRIKGLIVATIAISLLLTPTEEPFQVAKLFLDGRIAHVLLVNEELNELGKMSFVILVEGKSRIEILEMVFYGIELFDGSPCPLIDGLVLADELSHNIRRTRTLCFLFFLF